MKEEEEARRILTLVQGDVPKALGILHEQLNVLYARAQSLVGLAGVVVTVTGFSGRIIAATNRPSQLFIISGLALVLFSAWWVFWKVMRIRWVTGEITDDIPASITRVLFHRNDKTSALMFGGMLLFGGLLLYFIAIAIMLSNPEPLTIAPR